ncbi:MAG: MBL fold metallo-hydrolase RNA specificity domain-containing protein [Gemmatimonadales bacterium]
MRAWIDEVRAHSPELSGVWLVHGEPDAQDAFASTLGANGYDVRCPVAGMTATL